MEQPKTRLPSFQINDYCIGCMLCFERLPRFFKLSTDSLFSVVACQPETEEEYQWFCEAMNDCPASALEEIIK